MFISTQCPYSNAYNDRMRDMAAAYSKKGVQFVGINSNKTETVQDAVDHAKKHGHTFTILKDPGNKVADLYDARHTPEVFVVDKDGKLRYHGRIDENYEDAGQGLLAGPEERPRRPARRADRGQGRNEGVRLLDQAGLGV